MTVQSWLLPEGGRGFEVEALNRPGGTISSKEGWPSEAAKNLATHCTQCQARREENVEGDNHHDQGPTCVVTTLPSWLHTPVE